MKRILVVDDTKNIKTLLTKCLEIEGFEVMTASDGFEALDKFSKYTFDIAFLDIKLPFLSGTEVLKKIREMGITTPVIIITAYATIKNTFECTQLGAVAYIQKPFTADKIRNLLNELISSNKIEGENEENLIQRAQVLINSGKYNEGLVMLKNALSSQPLNSHIYYLLSNIHSLIGKEEEAKKFKLIYETLKNSFEN